MRLKDLSWRQSADKALAAKWGAMEKETLKKYLLNYGYGRWSKIRQQSASTCKILKEKPEAELHAFANDFVRTLFYNQQTEKNELKGFLLGLLENDKDAEVPYVENSQKDWGELISQRATPWAKRLQLLHRVQGLIKTFKQARKRFLA